MADKMQELFQVVFESAGADGVAKLEALLRQLAKTGDDADAKLSPLAEELARIGETQDAVRTLTATKAALAETTEEIAKTERQLQALRIVMVDPSASQAFAKEFDTAQASLARLTTRQKEQQLELTKAQGILARSGIDTRNLAAANAELGDRAANVARQAQAIVPALTQSGRAAHETAAGFGEIVEKSSFLRRVVDQVKGLAAAIAGLFALEKAKDTIGEIIAEGDKIARLRLQFEAAFGGVEAGADALERVNAIAQDLPLSLDDVQAAAVRAKKQGLDPFNGTLESLVAANAKFGGDVGSLNSLIDLLGKATQRGSVGLKDLIKLQQDGIPASQLLGEALGKTSDEILDLAKSGQLGRNSVALLIDALGRAGAGEAAGQLGLVSTLVTKVKDQWQDFLQLISESGAYDFVKEQLTGINQALRTGLADGSLRASARAISDTIVAIGRGIAGTTRFIVDHAAAIGAVVKAYVLFRATLLTLDLAGAAARFVGLGNAAAKAGAQAAAAAAESGGFGRLAARVKAIPKAIQIAVAVEAVDFALTNVEELISKVNEFYSTQQRQKNLDAEIAAQREQLATRASTIAAQLKGFADTQVASEEQLAAMSRAQSEAYVEQLQNATRYFTALRIQAQQAGDASAVESATATLRSLVVALQEAREHYQAIDEAIRRSSETVQGAVNRFDTLKSSGLSAAESIANAFEHVEIPTPQGVDDVLSILQQISIRSRDARAAVQSELAVALGKLDELDLRNFQANVTQRLAEAKGQADELRVALGAALQASLQKLGLSAQQAGVAITAAGEDLIATFDDIVRNAEASSQQVQLAFAQALSQASTEGEVSALQQQLTSAFNAGRIGAEQFAAASEAAGRKVAEIKAAAVEASATLDGMGTAGETSAQRISGALQETRDRLVVEANKIAQAINDALASGDDAGANALKAQFKTIDAELQSLNRRIADVGSNLGGIGRATIPAPDTRQFVAAVRQTEEISGEAAEQFQADADRAAEAAKSITGALGNALSAQAAFLSEFSGISSNAVDRFTKATREFFEGAGEFSQAAITDATGIIRYGEAIAQAGKLVEAEIAQQRAGVAALAQQYQDLTDSAIISREAAGQNLDRLAESLRGDAAAAREGRSAFDLLGAADLSPLVSSLEAAAARVDALKQKAIEAKDQLLDMTSSIEDAIDRARGNDVAIENRRFEEQLEQIKKLAEESGTLNSEEYRRAIQRAKELHQINLQNIKKEADAKRQAHADIEAETTTGGGTTAPGGGGGAGGGGVRKITTELVINGKSTNDMTDADVRKLADLMAKNPQAALTLLNGMLKHLRLSGMATGQFPFRG